TRHVLQKIIARQRTPDLYEVKPFPINRGVDQYTILRRPVSPLRLALLYLAPNARSLPDIRHLAQGAIRSVFTACRAENIAAELNQLPADIAHVLVLRQDWTIRDEATLWEAMRLFEMHGDVALASGRVLDETGTVIAACKPALPNAIWVGLKRDDP